MRTARLARDRQKHYSIDMRQSLILHPDSRCATVTSIAVEVARSRPGRLTLHYLVTGKIGDLRLPPVVAPARANELWRQTCFEAFVRAPGDGGYSEFNFSPSTQWAAYRFNGYRDCMTVADEVPAPRIDVISRDSRFELRVALDGLPGDAPWRLGLSAVIEEASGAKSYWALAHPPGHADFHHADCFALELPPA